jgi:predicted amidohydrolase
MTVAAAQPAIVAGDLAANVAAHAEVVRASGARLIVFPEMSLTGYVLDAPAVAADDPVLAPLIAACAEADAVALVGAPLDWSGAERIGVLAVTGAGARTVYAKMCLGDTEPDRFVAGPRPGVITVDGWRVGIGVCKDTRILEHLRETRDEGIDLYVAGLVHRPDELGELASRARRIALKIGVPVVFAAYAGPTGTFPATSGGSGIWDAAGVLITQAGSEAGEVVSAEVRPAG